MALTDTTADNGGLSVLPGSHRLNLPLRYTPFEDIYSSFSKILIRKKSRLLKAKKGHAVIYDSALIHFSENNRTNEIRYACGCVCIPESALSKHFYKDGDDILEFDIDGSFYNNMIMGKKPELKIVRKFKAPKINRLKIFASILFSLKK